MRNLGEISFSDEVAKKLKEIDTSTIKELEILNDLYQNELRLYKNLFQPVLKLKEKVRIDGKIHRQSEKAKTPYQRVIESKEVSKEKKQELKQIYTSLNPAQLKRAIDKKLDNLYRAYQKKNKSQEVEPQKKIKPISLTSYIRQPEEIHLPS